MKKILVNLVACLLIGASLISSIYFYKNNLISYLILSLVILLNVFIFYIIFLVRNRDEYSTYKSKVNKIKKTYEGILVKSNSLPTIDNKNVMFIDDILDLVDAQCEIRKPIYYYEEENCCTFILKDTEDVLIYSVKYLEDMKTSVETMIENNKQEAEKEKEKASKMIDKALLTELEKTAVFVFDDKVLKVSPVKEGSKSKNPKKSKVNEDEVKKLIKKQKQLQGLVKKLKQEIDK